MFLPVRWLIIENCVRCMKYDASIGFLYNVRSSHHTQTTVNTITIPSHAYHLVRAWPRTPRLQDVLLYMSVSHFAGCRLRVRGAAACSVGQLWRRPPTPLSCLPLPRPPRAGLRSSSLAPGCAELAPQPLSIVGGLSIVVTCSAPKYASTAASGVCTPLSRRRDV